MTEEDKKAAEKAAKVVQMLLPTKDFDDMLKEIVESLLVEIKKTKTEGVHPRIYAVGRKNFDEPLIKIPMMMIDISDDEFDMQDKLHLVGKSFHEKFSPFGLLGVFLVSEAWMKRFVGDEKPVKGKTPSEYDDKTEAVIIHGMTTDNRNNGVYFTVIRNERNEISLQKDPVFTLVGQQHIESNACKQFFLGWASAMDKKRGK